MAKQFIKLPDEGEKISVRDGKLVVPDNPIVGYVEGDGIGPDITRASLRVWDAAVAQAYGGKRKIHWCELFMGEKAASMYDGDYFPRETVDALTDLIVSIKGPLTTPVGGGFRSLNVALRQTLDLYACVRPVAERALGVFHDIAFMHQGDALAAMVDGVLDGFAYQTLGAESADRLDAEAGVFKEIHFHLVA